MIDKEIILEIIKGLVALASLALTLLITRKITGLHKQINSRMDQLIELKKEEGNVEGRAQLKNEQNEKQ